MNVPVRYDEQEAIDVLDDLVNGLYLTTQRNVNYPLGELDYIGINQMNQADVYEVKRSKRGMHKARKQLIRSDKAMNNIRNRYLFLFLENELYLLDDSNRFVQIAFEEIT